MRESGPREENKLNDFQQVLVLLAAILKGDHHDHHELVDNMTVIEAVNYVEAAFGKFLEEGEKAKNRGADESHIPCLASPHPKKDVKSFAQKLFSCLVCDN